VLHAARRNYRTQKSPSGQHHTSLSGHIFATKARIDNRKKNLLTAITPPHVIIIWRTSAHYRLRSVGEFVTPLQISTGFGKLGSVTARQCGSERQPNVEALNRGRHLYSAGRPSRWALAHILVCFCFVNATIASMLTSVNSMDQA